MKILKKIHVTNWHYIDFRTIDLNGQVNFFTGHSGSGKSTLVDAMQVVLYGDTDGRSFFNKAAGKDKKRTLIEYLRGMRNETNNGKEYKRNKNFVSYIVLEFFDEETNETFCMGLIAEVSCSENKFDNIFFHLKGSLPDDKFTMKKVDGSSYPLLIKEFKELYKHKAFIFNTNKEYTKHFLNVMGNMNDNYSDIFKKSIAFNMDSNIQQFIREFICPDKTIEVEDMQDNIRNYKKIKNIINNAEKEILYLDNIEKKNLIVENLKGKENLYNYYIDKTLLKSEMLKKKQLLENINKNTLSINSFEDDINFLEKNIETTQQKLDEINVIINSNEIVQIEKQYQNKISLLDQELNIYNMQLNSYTNEKTKLLMWKKQYNQLSNEIYTFLDKLEVDNVSLEELTILQEYLLGEKEKLQLEKNVFLNNLNEFNKSIESLQYEINQLKLGKKIYINGLVEIKKILEDEFFKITNRQIDIPILCDIIDIKTPLWKNAIEGYLNTNKFNLVPPPSDFDILISVYEALNHKFKHNVSLVNTLKLEGHKAIVNDNSLATEIETNNIYARKYIDFLIGNLIKCQDINSLKVVSIGITPTCLVHKSFVIKTINSKFYEESIIGTSNIEEQIEFKTRKLNIIKEDKKNLENDFIKTAAYKVNSFFVINDVEDFYNKEKVPLKIKEIENQKLEYETKLNSLNFDIIEQQKIEKSKLVSDLSKYRLEKDKLITEKSDCNGKVKYLSNALSEIDCTKFENKIKTYDMDWLLENNIDEQYEKYIEKYYSNLNDIELVEKIENSINRIKLDMDNAFKELSNERKEYCNSMNITNLDIYARDNEEFNARKIELVESELPKYKASVDIQFKKAQEQFKNDFIYKISDNIKFAKSQINEINKSISKNIFGKEKYKYTIKGSSDNKYRKFYEMFNDPNIFSNNSLFSFDFESTYKDTIEELFDLISYTDDNLTNKDKLLENVKLYCDYRTYLEFDMEVQFEDGTRSELSKTLSKNSGGETQNPLYISILSSYTQLYRLGVPQKQKNTTMKLIIFDEAFNKMDATKVKACLDLLRNMGLQAIIVAPDDKMQNYLESINKMFLFSCDNKEIINIREFDKKEIDTLV